MSDDKWKMGVLVLAELFSVILVLEVTKFVLEVNLDRVIGPGFEMSGIITKFFKLRYMRHTI